MAKNTSDYYDEDMHDQDPRMDSTDPTATKNEDQSDSDAGGYATFLAPKASFAGKDLAVGAVHRVRVERVLDDEVELKCIQPGKGDDEPETADNAQEEQDEMYTEPMACDPQTLIDGARCFECFGSNGVMLDAMEIVLLCAIRDGDTSMACDPQTLISQSNCIIQCVPLGMMQAVKIYLLCQIAAGGGGGGGGGTQVTCASGVPVAAPATACALYVDTDTGTIYSYYSGAWH